MKEINELQAILEGYSEEVKQMPSGDSRARLTAIVDRTRELIVMADAQASDGRNNEQTINWIYKWFGEIQKSIT